MNDRELLEMAARAAGLKVLRGRNITGMFPEMNALAAPLWSPLTDDGDALRLAVKLQLQIRPNDYDVMVVAHLPAHITVAEVCDRKDPYAATRRAIVRAAAEIGRTMTTRSVR
jgi:hypothetical protein